MMTEGDKKAIRYLLPFMGGAALVDAVWISRIEGLNLLSVLLVLFFAFSAFFYRRLT